MKQFTIVLFLFFISISAFAHSNPSNPIDEKGGHWYYRLGTYHQHIDVGWREREDLFYDPRPDRDLPLSTDLHFMRMNLRTYRLGNGKHGFGIQGGIQRASELAHVHDGQWTLGGHYRIKHSEQTWTDWRVDYYKINKFGVIDFIGMYGFELGRGKVYSLSFNAGVIMSTANNFAENTPGVIGTIEFGMRVGTIVFRGDFLGGDIRIFSIGVTYEL